MQGNFLDWMMGISININPTHTRLTRNTAAPKRIMTATVSALVILLMELDFGLIVQIHLVIALEKGVTCIKDRMLKGFEKRSVKETTVHLVKENASVKLKEESIMKEELQQKRSLKELGTGLNTSVHQERSTTTIANQKSRSGKNLVSGLTGKKTRNTNVTESDIDVIEIATVNENMSDRIPLGVPAVLRIDIPVLIDLLCRIVIVVIAICHRHVRRKIETTTEIIHHFSILCRNLPSLEGTVMNDLAKIWTFHRQTVLQRQKLQDQKLPLHTLLIQG